MYSAKNYTNKEGGQGNDLFCKHFWHPHTLLAILEAVAPRDSLDSAG